MTSESGPERVQLCNEGRELACAESGAGSAESDRAIDFGNKRASTWAESSAAITAPNQARDLGVDEKPVCTRSMVAGTGLTHAKLCKNDKLPEWARSTTGKTKSKQVEDRSDNDELTCAGSSMEGAALSYAGLLKAGVLPKCMKSTAARLLPR